MLKVTKRFIDKETRDWHEVGDLIDLGKKRNKRAVNRGLGKIVDGRKAKKKKSEKKGKAKKSKAEEN